VDDDTVNRRLARSLLEKNGFQVVEADDGMAAVELLKLESGFSLMVLDLEMPAMGGGRCAETCEKFGQYRRTPGGCPHRC
jgi:CheY-like chemotaxis protein